MSFDPKIHRRRSVRLKNYDYSQNGAYFVTICCAEKKCFFGKIEEGKMILNEGGKIAEQCWKQIPEHFPQVFVDCFVVMPNHVHGIVVIENGNPETGIVGAQNFVPKTNFLTKTNSKRAEDFLPLQTPKSQFQKIIPRSLSSIVRGYKIGVTKWFRANTKIHTIWQRNYHEYILRNESSLAEIREYIIHNPQKWKQDTFFVHES